MQKHKKPVTILGIDPGFAITGYGIITDDRRSIRLVAGGVISSTPKMPYAERLKKIFNGISKLCKHFKPDVVAIEQLFFTSNATTAMRVGEARGVAILAAGLAGIPIREFTPLQVKQAIVGYGRADKRQVQLMVKALLKLKTLPHPDDMADALAIAICCGGCRQ